jgi:hypothetical protein
MKAAIVFILLIGLTKADNVPAWFIVLHGEALGYTPQEIQGIYQKNQDVPLRAATPDTSALANITVTLKPLSLKSTKLVYNNTQVGIWTIAVKNNSIYNLNSIDRNTIMTEFPDIPDFPNTLARDVLTRDADTSFWGLVKIYLKEILSIGPSGLTAAGLATNNKSLGYWGLGASVATYLISRASARSPNPTPYFSNLLPDIISVAAGHSSQTYYLVTPLIHDVKSIKLSINVPVL